MARESFYEESCAIIDVEGATKKRLIFFIASLICIIVGIVPIIYGWTTIDDRADRTLAVFFVALIPGTLFIIAGIFLWYKKNNVFLEFDYTLLTDEIRIAKIINQKDRRRVIEFDIEKIERVGKVKSATYEEYAHSLSVKKLVLTKNKTAAEGKGFFYIAVNTEKGKKLLTLECTESFIFKIVTIAGKFVLEKNYK